MTAPVIVGQDPIVRKVARLAERLAHTTHPILVEGERGVGRGHLARFLHARGPRAAAPFSIIDFGDVVRGEHLEQLVAKREEASGGTLLIKGHDLLPVEELAPAVQLLVEASDSTRVVLAPARSEALEESVRGPDLAERLGALNLYLPSLRMRRSDIPELAQHLVAGLAGEDGGAAVIGDAAMVALWRYDWPGNVRELRDELAEALGRSEGREIGARHLSASAPMRRRGGTTGGESGSRMLAKAVPGVAAALSIL